MSDQTHSAVERAARIVGVRPESIVKIPADELFQLTPEALEEAIGRTRRGGLTPIAVCANAGTTNTGAVDPLPAIADVCVRERIWMHVDAAYGGVAGVDDPGRRPL